MEIKTLIRQLQFLFSAFLIAQVTFLGIVSFVHEPQTLKANSLLTQFPFITASILLPFAYWFFRKQIDNIVQINDLHEKITAYRAACLIKWACFEGATLLAIVVFFLTKNTQLQYLAAFLVVHFALHFPNNVRVYRDLQISEL